jgi:hypothetical protein
MNIDDKLRQIEFLAYSRIKRRLSAIYGVQGEMQYMTNTQYRFQALRYLMDETVEYRPAIIALCLVSPERNIETKHIGAINLDRLFSCNNHILEMNKVIHEIADEIADNAFKTELQYLISRFPSTALEKDKLTVFDINRSLAYIANRSKRSAGNHVILNKELIDDEISKLAAQPHRQVELHHADLEDIIVTAHVQSPNSPTFQAGQMALDAGIFFMLRKIEIREYCGSFNVLMDHAIYEDEDSAKYYEILKLT